MTDTPHTDDTPHILPGLVDMLRHMAEPGGELICGAPFVSPAVAGLEALGLIRLERLTAEQHPVFHITQEGRDYVESLA